MSENIFLKTIERGKQSGFIEIDEVTERITYRCKRDYNTSFKNPEEKVRAAYLTELILDYSPEFIVIRPHNIVDSFYIAGVLRTDLMLKYMYSKTRGGTPSRYRLSEGDFIKLDFPIATKEEREEKSKEFKKALSHYDLTIKNAEKELIRSHSDIENEL